MLPDRAGTYVLLLHVAETVADRWIEVGRLGRFPLAAGWYAYVGSARGSGGLAARVGHHLRLPRSYHWHIDYLRAVSRPVLVWYTTDPERENAGKRGEKLECLWAQALIQLPGATIPIPRFGASDCRCPAHLVHYPRPPALTSFARMTGNTIQCTPVRPTRHSQSQSHSHSQ